MTNEKRTLFAKVILEEKAKLLLSQRDKEFLLRIYNTPQDTYLTRLKQIGMTNHERVLDAGCGFGQWSFALSKLNNSVCSIDIDAIRLNITKELLKFNEQKNIFLLQGSIDTISFKENTFDAIFCYSSIYYTDYKKCLYDFYRILKPDGSLYFSTNGIGWYIHNLINQPYASDDFNPQKMAIDAIKNTFKYFNIGETNQGQSIVMPSEITLKQLKHIGFRNVYCAGEGSIPNNPILNNTEMHFFNSTYYDEEGVYEVLCTK